MDLAGVLTHGGDGGGSGWWLKAVVRRPVAARLKLTGGGEAIQ